MRLGNARRVVTERSGWNGEPSSIGDSGVPVEGHAFMLIGPGDGEPPGEGSGDGGPAVLGVMLRRSRVVARAFLRGGWEAAAVSM